MLASVGIVDFIVNPHFVWRAASAPLSGDGQEKGKKRHLTEGMTEKNLRLMVVINHRTI
jgi:hypothetical protein